MIRQEENRKQAATEITSQLNSAINPTVANAIIFQSAYVQYLK